MVKRIIILACCLMGCTAQAQFPTALVLTHEFTDDQAAQIVAAVDMWRGVGAHLSITIGDVAHSVNMKDGVTPVYPAILFGLMGETNQDGVRLNVMEIERRWGSFALTRFAAHEFGHVLGLGPPANADQHILSDGDIMCNPDICVMRGSGALSDADVEAWRNGGAR